MSPESPFVEYPDSAGYPDGMGFLDEGTAPSAPGVIAAELSSPSADAPDDIEVIAEESGYRAMLGGDEVAIMRVVRGDHEVTLRSTVVDPDARNQGIGTALIAHVLDELRDAGQRIRVECDEVARFVARHPQYADLIA